MSFTGSTRLEVITVLSRTTTSAESLDEALRTLITYIESKRKRGKRSVEEVGRKLEELEARFAPYGLAFVFHRARLLSGLNASSVPAVRDAAVQRLNALTTSPASTSSASTALPPVLLPPSLSTSPSVVSIGNPYVSSHFQNLRRPPSPTDTYASSSFRGRDDGIQSRSSSDGWVFNNPSPEAEDSEGGGWEGTSRNRSAQSSKMGARDQGPRTGRPRTAEVETAEEEVRRHVEEKIRALQLVLEQIKPTSQPKSPSNSSSSANLNPPVPSSRQRSTSNASSSSRPPRSSREPAISPPPLPPTRKESTSSYNPSIFSTTESVSSSRSSYTVASPVFSSSPSSAYKRDPPRSNSFTVDSRSQPLSPNRSLPTPPPLSSRNALGLGIQLETPLEERRSSRRRGLLSSRSPSSERLSTGGWSEVGSPNSDSLPSYETVLEDVVTHGKESRSRRREAIARPDTSPTLGWGSFA